MSSISTRPNFVANALAYLVVGACCSFASQAYAVRYDVYSGEQLQQVMQTVVAGDEIVLQPGGYKSVASIAASGTDLAHYFGKANGTSQKPITLRSVDATKPQELVGGTTSAKYGLYITGDYWIVKNISVTNSQKGIMLDNANHVVIDNVIVHDVGQEAIHLRDNSSNNIVKNSRIYNTGLVDAGYGEAFYVGSHPGSTNSVGYVYGPDCNFNVIGGNTIGPGIAAEHIDIKAGVLGTVFEYNVMNGVGMTGANSADSFIDVKGNGSIIRGNKAYRNGESNILNIFEVHAEVANYETTFIGNQGDLDGGSGSLIYVHQGIAHVSADNKRLDGGSPLTSKTSRGTIDSNIPSNIPAPGNYSNSAQSSSVSSASSSSSSTPSSQASSSKAASSAPAGACASYINVAWNTRTEVTLTSSACVRFDRNLSGSSVQFWDSDTNTSCDFAGVVSSVDGAGSVSINSTYVTTASLTGTTLRFANAAGNSCKYIKLRAF
jgi:hypothetical protein